MIRQFIIVFGVLFGFTVTIIKSKSYTVQIDEVKLLNSSYLSGFYNFSKLSVSKFNRSTFVLNVDMEFLTDFDEEYFIGLTYYFKKRPGSNWNKKFFTWPKRPICDALKIFNRFAMQGYNNTNIPQFEEGQQYLFLRVN